MSTHRQDRVEGPFAQEGPALVGGRTDLAALTLPELQALDAALSAAGSGSCAILADPEGVSVVFTVATKGES